MRGLAPKFPQLSGQALQAVLDVGAATLKFYFPNIKNNTNLSEGNGQWSMPARHKANPFCAQAVKREKNNFAPACLSAAHLRRRM